MKLFYLVLQISPLWSSVWPHFLSLYLDTHINTCIIYAYISTYLLRECMTYWCSPGVQAQSTSQRIHSNTFSWLTFNQQVLVYHWHINDLHLFLGSSSLPRYWPLFQSLSGSSSTYPKIKHVIFPQNLFSYILHPSTPSLLTPMLSTWHPKHYDSGSLAHIILIVKPYWFYHWSISIVTTSLHSDFNSGFLISLLDILKFWIEV